MQVTAATIKNRLLSNLEQVLVHLFPNGKTIGHEFRVGSTNGEAGKSLAVQLRGANRGVWQDFAFGNDPAYKGDILSLWAAARGKTFKEAFPEMKTYCGFTHAEPIQRRAKPKVPKDGIEKLTPPVHEYLAGRGLSDHTLKKYRVRSHKRRSSENEHFMLFPFIDSEGDPVLIKSTGINKREDGSKDIWTPTDPYYTLWGWWTVPDDARELIICEGEIDAMSLYQMGVPHPVLSLPSGTSNMDWIENDWEALQRFERFWLVTDMDQPHPKTGIRAGEAAAKEMSKRLGANRCVRVPIPSGLNDVNEVLLAGDEYLLEWEQRWLPDAYTFDPPTIGTVDDVRQEAIARLQRQQRFREENTFIWPKVPFQYRNGEMTVVSGYPHGGKSAWLYQTHVHEMWLGEKVFFVSFEIDPEAMIVEFAHILLGKTPDETELNDCMDWMSGRFYFFRRKKREKTLLPDLLADMDYAVQRFGCSRLAVDSLHFLARKEDYEGQDNVSLQLTNFAKSRDVHVALVAHSVQKKGEDVIPGMGMVEGSGGITKPIDNGVTIWRNVKKEEAILKAQEGADDKKLEKAFELHDGVMKFWKNRETGRLPHVRLWFDEGGKSYRLKRDDDVYCPLGKPPPKDQEEGELF
jgi:twinkle protein